MLVCLAHMQMEVRDGEQRTQGEETSMNGLKQYDKKRLLLLLLILYSCPVVFEPALAVARQPALPSCSLSFSFTLHYYCGPLTACSRPCLTSV